MSLILPLPLLLPLSLGRGKHIVDVGDALANLVDRSVGVEVRLGKEVNDDAHLANDK